VVRLVQAKDDADASKGEEEDEAVDDADGRHGHLGLVEEPVQVEEDGADLKQEEDGRVIVEERPGAPEEYLERDRAVGEEFKAVDVVPNHAGDRVVQKVAGRDADEAQRRLCVRPQRARKKHGVSQVRQGQDGHGDRKHGRDDTDVPFDFLLPREVVVDVRDQLRCACT